MNSLSEKSIKNIKDHINYFFECFKDDYTVLDKYFLYKSKVISRRVLSLSSFLKKNDGLIKEVWLKKCLDKDNFISFDRFIEDYGYENTYNYHYMYIEKKNPYKYFIWGTYGKVFKKIQYVKLDDMDTKHIEAIIENNFGGKIERIIFKQELKIRNFKHFSKFKDISIEFV